jgi:hypothetical protein
MNPDNYPLNKMKPVVIQRCTDIEEFSGYPF